MPLYPRLVLDYEASDLIRLLRWKANERADLQAISRRLAAGRPFAPALSVRTAFDLFLSLLPGETGDEVVFSAVTVPGMPEIARRRGYRVRVADIDPQTLAVDPAELKRVVSARTRLFVFAPLFGTYGDTGTLAAVCRKHDILFVEDAAQAWDGAYRGSEHADAVLFSFGPAKTATALAGAVAVFRSAATAEQFREAESRLPRQSPCWLFKRALKYALVLPLRQPAVLGAFDRLARNAGIDMEVMLGSFTKGFPGADLLAQIRRRLPAPVRHLMATKLASHPGAGERRQRAEAFLAMLDPAVAVPGRKAPNRSYWLTAIAVERPEELVARLRSLGFDATRGSSSLTAILDDETGRPAPRAAAMMESLVYLPLSRFTGARELRQMAAVVNEHARGMRKSDVLEAQ